MDPRRLLTLAGASLLLTGCANLREAVRSLQAPAASPALAVSSAPPSLSRPAVAAPAPPARLAAMAPIPNPAARRPAEARSAETGAVTAPAPPSLARPASRRGPPAIAAANVSAREVSSSGGFIGGMQVFSYEAGRIYEVWTAPLRVTTLTLAPGEAVVSKAAGDTVRWQIGETTSGQGAAQRSHVMIKPLERGLETNLVLATNQRIYLVQLRSGAPDAFNAAVSWDLGAALTPGPTEVADVAGAPPELVAPAGPLDGRFRIQAKGRPPAWTPTAVLTDGVRTFLRFPPDLSAGEAPGLFVLGETGEPQLVNYRQQNGLWVVDRVFDRAELRIGDRRGSVVRITREGARS